MATSATTTAGAAVAAAIPQVARQVAEQAAKNAPWISNMPTRAIANVLLQQERHMMDHGQLYEEAEKSGLMRSRRHFKHCLRMMKDQNRVKIICNGPEKPGSAKRKFSVQLSRRGSTIYTRYSKTPEEAFGRKSERGLKDALV